MAERTLQSYFQNFHYVFDPCTKIALRVSHSESFDLMANFRSAFEGEEETKTLFLHQDGTTQNSGGSFYACLHWLLTLFSSDTTVHRVTFGVQLG